MDDEALSTLVEQLRRVGSLEEWSAAADDLSEVYNDSGLFVYKDRTGHAWTVFGLPWQVERVQVDLATEALSEQLSPAASDQLLMQWIDSFYQTQVRVAELLGTPVSYVGYFEDTGFPEEPGALYLAQWHRAPAPQIMLSYSGHEHFDYPKKRSRLSLKLTRGPLSTDLLRLYRQYLLWPTRRPGSSSC